MLAEEWHRLLFAAKSIAQEWGRDVQTHTKHKTVCAYFTALSIHRVPMYSLELNKACRFLSANELLSCARRFSIRFNSGDRKKQAHLDLYGQHTVVQF